MLFLATLACAFWWGWHGGLGGSLLASLPARARQHNGTHGEGAIVREGYSDASKVPVVDEIPGPLYLSDPTLQGRLPDPKYNSSMPAPCSPATFQNLDLAMLKRYLASARHYFEFGAGYSTVFVAGVSAVESVHSVESDINWIHGVLTNIPADLLRKVTFHMVDINGGVWSSPRDNSMRHNFPGYSQVIGSVPEQPDVILVDGRFRVACACQAALRVLQATDGEEAIILIHDYKSRPHYKVVERFLDVVEAGIELTAFRLAPAASASSIQKIYDKYAYTPG